MRANFKVGDRVIYKSQKWGPRPSAAAKSVHPSPRGEDYNYYVPKFWVVEKVLEKGVLVIRTRKGKRREVGADDARLRRASILERFLYRHKFPADVAAERPSSDPSLRSA